VSTGAKKNSNASLSKTISGQSSSEALMKGMEVEKEAVVLKPGEPKRGGGETRPMNPVHTHKRCTHEAHRVRSACASFFGQPSS
jgi:hypothetical protein